MSISVIEFEFSPGDRVHIWERDQLIYLTVRHCVFDNNGNSYEMSNGSTYFERRCFPTEEAVMEDLKEKEVGAHKQRIEELDEKIKEIRYKKAAQEQLTRIMKGEQ